MSQDIRDFVPPSCDLLALGEPTHQEPAFARLRNDLFAELVGHGFRSVALETDRVAALTVDDYVREGVGTLDTVMREGFSHGFGELDGNRRLIAWMRAYNEGRPPEERLTFHGFDAPLETMSAPSPRPYLEHAAAYLRHSPAPGPDLDFAPLVGDDERWSRTEAVLDPARSVGDSADAARLRVIADDMLAALHERAPELIAATSRDAWARARIHLTAVIGLLRYHREAAQRIEEGARVTRLCVTRDMLMARNLLDIRRSEARRGPTLVFSHNLHLQRNPGTLRMGDTEVNWYGAGAVVASLEGERYTFVAGSLGRSEAIALGEPDPDTYEGGLQRRVATWALAPAAEIPAARTRTDTTPAQGYFPLDQATLDGADAVLHIAAG
jgi:erythromycin esterase-like protein